MDDKSSYTIKKKAPGLVHITHSPFYKKLWAVLFLCLGGSSLYSIIYCASKNYWIEAGLSLVLFHIFFLGWLWQTWGQFTLVLNQSDWTLTKVYLFKNHIFHKKTAKLSESPLVISSKKSMGLDKWVPSLVSPHGKTIITLGSCFTENELDTWKNLFKKRIK